VEAGARAAGYSLVVGDTWEDGEQEHRVVQQLVDRRVDGLLLVPSPDAVHLALPFLSSTGVPVVLLDRFVDVDLDQVAPDNHSPTALLTLHLADLGHRRIAFVAGLEGLHTSEERLAGHLEVVADRGLDPDPSLVVRGGSQVDEAEQAVRALLQAHSRPDALVVANNAMTIGTLRALRALGVRVPHDVPLVCYDDFEWSDLFEPRLTAISQDVTAMGARAVELLVDRIGGQAGAPRRERIATTYHHRTSCGCADADGS
jgi:LacI family transcriptional regulator